MHEKAPVQKPWRPGVSEALELEEQEVVSSLLCAELNVGSLEAYSVLLTSGPSSLQPPSSFLTSL